MAVGLGAAGLVAAAVLVPLALGVGDLGADWRLLCGLTAACAPLAGCTCVAAQLAAALHARGRFAAAAACPILLNLFWLAGVAAAAWAMTHGTPGRTAIYWVAGAVTAAGFAQVLFLAFALRRAGFVWRWDPAGTRAAVAGVRAAVLPVLLGLSVTQLNALLDGLLAWGLAAPAGDPAAELVAGVEYPLEPGSASRLYFAQRLYQFPVGVFGVAVGTVLFPRFAAAAPGQLKTRRRRGAAAGLVRRAAGERRAGPHGRFVGDRPAGPRGVRRGGRGGDGGGGGGAGGRGVGGLRALRPHPGLLRRRRPGRAGENRRGGGRGEPHSQRRAGLAAGADRAGPRRDGGDLRAVRRGDLVLWHRAAPGWRPARLAGAAGRAALGAAGAAAGCLAARWAVGPAGLGWSTAAELSAAVVAAVAVFLPLAYAFGMNEVGDLVGVRRRRG